MTREEVLLYQSEIAMRLALNAIEALKNPVGLDAQAVADSEAFIKRVADDINAHMGSEPSKLGQNDVLCEAKRA
ncbi:MAG TPA: hypothetical protein VFC26_03355 [Verrucomicrobiae bacterium]|nr:hypothetical protein [Verrucomicrobiae bacterium]